MARRYTEKLHPRDGDGKWTDGATGLPSVPRVGKGTRGKGPAADKAATSDKAGEKGKPKPARAAKGMTTATAKGFIDGHYSGWRKDLTPAQDKAMRFYQSPGFALMNGQLRGLDAGGLKASERASDADLARARKASKDLTAAIKAAPPLPEPVVVFRGFSADQFGNLEKGATIVDKGFTSTSLTNDAGAVGKASRKATAEITLSAGTRAAAGSARELVLPPGSKFRIVNVTTRGGAPHVTMEYVPPAGGKPPVTASLAVRSDELGDDPDDDLTAEEIAFVDGLGEPSAEDLAEVAGPLTAAGKRGKNWVEQTGTGHLPRYIKRISKHLRRKGMTESHAIAVAVNVAKRMCATGDLNFKGLQQVNAKSRAQACAAVAEWNAKRAQARAT